MHYPRRRRRWPRRILGVFATLAFLGSGVAIAYMVIPRDETATPPPQSGAAPAAPKKTAPALTKAQKKARQG